MIAIEITDMLLRFMYDHQLHENNFISSSLIQRFLKLIEQYSKDNYHQNNHCSNDSNYHYHQTYYFNYYYNNYNTNQSHYHIFDGLKILPSSSPSSFLQHPTYSMNDDIHSNDLDNDKNDNDEF